MAQNTRHTAQTSPHLRFCTLDVVPGDDEKWVVYLRDAVAVFRATGLVPRGESHPGGWLGNQRRAARSGKPWMTTERQDLLDELLPGWRETPPPSLSWPQTAAKLHEHVEATGRLPRQNGETADERRLGIWLANQRVAHHSRQLDPARAAWLEAHFPGWAGAGPRESAWERRAQELGEYVVSTAWLPNRRSSDPTERRLGNWLKNRRRDYRTGRLSVARVALLDELAPGWSEPAGVDQLD